jgi:phosphoribosylformylglycinamidine synthase
MHLALTDSEFAGLPIDLPMSLLFGKPPKMHRRTNRPPMLGDAFDHQGVSFTESVERVLTFPCGGLKKLFDHDR